MATYNSAEDALKAFQQQFAENSDMTIFQIAQFKKNLENILKDFPVNEVAILKEKMKDNNDAMTSVLNKVVEANNNAIKAQEDYIDKVDNLNKEIKKLTEQIANSTGKEKEQNEKKLEQKQQELNDVQAQHKAQLQDREQQYLEEKEQRDKEIQTRKDNVEKLKNLAEDSVTKAFSYIVSMIKTSADNIASFYEQNAGSMAASLNSSVTAIGDLQRNIAKELRDTSLNQAISNLAVMSEANNLISSGYTNINKLDANSIAIATGREIAPNLDFNNSTVKNLMNVFGSDFITKFSAIQAAVQSSAGSVIDIKQNLSKMMDDLAPVYLNADLNNAALQATSDVQATISYAIDTGKIDKAESQAYLSMITELMDPTKAFSSNNTAVKVAAMNYDFSSGSAFEALEAIQSARQGMYSGLGTGLSYGETLARGLTAGVYGDNAMTAMFNPKGLYDLDLIRSADLGTTAEEQMSKLQSGDLTTQKEKESNIATNAVITQGFAWIKEKFPSIYEVFGNNLFALINTLPVRIAAAIKASDAISGKLLGKGSSGSSSGSGALLNTAGGALAKGGTLAKLLKGAGVIGSAGIVLDKLINWDTDEKGFEGFMHNIGNGGEGNTGIFKSIAEYGTIGATIGSFFPGVGTLAGAGLGATAGVIIGGIAKSLDDNTEAVKAQTKATSENSDSIKTNSTISQSLTAGANNNVGIVHLKSGDYELDYQKSSYAGFSSGLDYVPYDDMVVRLHKGEAVVSASAADKLRKQNPNFWNNAVDDNNSIVNALKEQTENLVDAFNGETKFSPLTKAGPKQYKITNQFAY